MSSTVATVADLDGNIITGELNLGADPGSTWQFSRSGEWTLIDNDITNTNGPAALTIDGKSTLIVGFTPDGFDRSISRRGGPASARSPLAVPR